MNDLIFLTYIFIYNSIIVKWHILIIYLKNEFQSDQF